MTLRCDRGQAALALAAGALIVLGGGLALAWAAAGVTAHGARQRAADLGALAAARALLDGRGSPALALRSRARHAGAVVARANGARRIAVVPGPGPLPDRVTVLVSDPVRLPGGVLIGGRARAVAAVAAGLVPIGDGAYGGPFARRQGRPMRPDVALAFDRLAAAAARAGHPLTVVSAFRTDAEQARLFAARPDPRWVARPGTSLHRLGTELDLGPASAYGWLAAHAGAFGFVRRYAWEPWHLGCAFTR